MVLGNSMLINLVSWSLIYAFKSLFSISLSTKSLFFLFIKRKKEKDNFKKPKIRL